MPEPNQVHVDTALTNVSIAYRNNEYVAGLIAPTVPVRKQSDKYFVYDPEREGMRGTEDARAPGAEANEVNFALSTDSYFCDDHALSAAIPDEERENADPVIQPDIDRTEFLTDKIELNREISLEALLRNSTAIPEAVLENAERWDIPDNDPLPRFQVARNRIYAESQKRANTVVLPYRAFDCLRNHPKVVERVQYSSAGVVSEALIAQLLDVDRVIVPRAFKNVAAKGQAASVEPIWNTDIYMLYVPSRPTLKQVAVAYTFVWTGAGGSASGCLVERWREPRRKADMIRVQRYYDQKLVAPGAAFRIRNALA